MAWARFRGLVTTCVCACVRACVYRRLHTVALSGHTRRWNPIRPSCSSATAERYRGDGTTNTCRALGLHAQPHSGRGCAPAFLPLSQSISQGEQRVCAACSRLETLMHVHVFNGAIPEPCKVSFHEAPFSEAAFLCTKCPFGQSTASISCCT